MAYHHALACISLPQAYIINRRLHYFRNDDIQNFVLMIYKAFRLDDIHAGWRDWDAWVQIHRLKSKNIFFVDLILTFLHCYYIIKTKGVALRGPRV